MFLRNTGLLALSLTTTFFFVTNISPSTSSPPTLAQSSEAELDFATIEADILTAMNEARTDPQGYIAKLEAFKQYYQGRRRVMPGEPAILTREGVAAVDSAITYMQGIDPLPALSLSAGMTQAARDHALDQGEAGTVGHTGSDGSQPSDRMNRYGTWQRRSGENISYGPVTGEQVVMRLIVDDGVLTRGHRRNILSPLYKVAGVACSSHSVYRVVCVTTFAGGYEEQ